MHCTMLILACVCAYAIDHVEPESKIKRSKFEGCSEVHKQALGCKDANIIDIKASSSASHPILDFYF
jgi:hypothetical protein